MSQSGVGVRMTSHKCRKCESEWSKCEKKSKESMRIITPPNSLEQKYRMTIHSSLPKCRMK